MSLDRRHFLAASASLATLSALGTARAATAPHRFTHGAFEISVVSDGYLALPTAALAGDAPAEARAAALKSAGQTGEQYQSPTNCTLIRAGRELILIDAGSGAHFMPSAGKLTENLEAVGIAREAITQIVFTHGHPDHLWGLVDELDDLAFPNARYVAGAAEWDFWHGANAERGLPSERAGFVTGARRSFARIKDKVTMVKAGDDIVPGIRVFDTRGHTQGHFSLEISGGHGLIVAGDALTHPVISFAHPDWRPASDHEPEVAIATRRKLLERLATDRTRLIGFHLPFPGTGIVERNGTAYRFAALS
jgi:glyoxylase-like metal-dependent hydrolase (beta-lactamase superfamily II)